MSQLLQAAHDAQARFGFTPRHEDGPQKLHVLLATALADLEVIEQNKNFKVDMTTWCHLNEICKVCLAGAYAVSSQLPPVGDDEDLIPSGLSNRMEALNMLRTGAVGEATAAMGLGYSSGRQLARYLPTYYHPNWWPEMRKLLADLQAADL